MYNQQINKTSSKTTSFAPKCRAELLAPVGGVQSFFTAIAEGADAVYLGLKSFSARANAENFELDNLASICKYAHTKNVKVYLAINTVLTDRELAKLCQTLDKILQCGIDALIFADFGLFSIIKKYYPNFEMHLSTQGGVFNLLGGQLAKQVGIDRVILARESELLEVEKIAKIIQTEVFVCGAVCTSFSGQCLLSSMLNGKSGNRGKCLQPCRLLYTYDRGKDKKTGYFLSSKDLFSLSELDKLLQINVASFKIEGRMRRAEYVAEAVKLFRNKLDNNKILSSDNLKKLFNRGNYHKALFLTRKGIIYNKVQGHMGLNIGKISRVSAGQIASVDLTAGSYLPKQNDAYKILTNGLETANGIFKSKISSTKFEIFYRGKLQVGSQIFVTTDSSLALKETPAQLPDIKFEVEPKIKFDKQITSSSCSQKIANFSFYDPKIDYSKFDKIVFSPTNYSELDALSKLKCPQLYLNIPPFLYSIDLKMIENILKSHPNLGIFANSFFAITLAKVHKRKLIISDKLNITNSLSLDFYSQFTSDIIISTELNTSQVRDLYNQNFLFTRAEKSIFMALNHCPMQENFAKECKTCDYKNTIEYKNSCNQSFSLKRKKLVNCYFYLTNNLITLRQSENATQEYYNFEYFSKQELYDYQNGNFSNLKYNKGYSTKNF